MGICGATNLNKLPDGRVPDNPERIGTLENPTMNSPRVRCDTITPTTPVPLILEQQEEIKQQQPEIDQPLPVTDPVDPTPAKETTVTKPPISPAPVPFSLVADSTVSARYIDKLVSKQTKKSELQEMRSATPQEDSQEGGQNTHSSRISSEIFRLGDPICEYGPVTVYNSLDTTGRLWSMKVIKLTEEQLTDERHKGLCAYIQQVINTSLSLMTHKNLVKYTYCGFNLDQHRKIRFM